MCLVLYVLCYTHCTFSFNCSSLVREYESSFPLSFKAICKFLFMKCSYLLSLDRTNWETNIFTSLLIPYIFFSLPSWIFGVFRWLAFHALVLSTSSPIPNFVFVISFSWYLISWLHRAEIGRWIALIAVVLRLFVSRRLPGMFKFHYIYITQFKLSCITSKLYR